MAETSMVANRTDDREVPGPARNSSLRWAQGPSRGWRAWLFPLGLWLMSTLYFGGGLGHYCDDYALSMLDPETGRLDRALSPFFYNPYFWRPAHQFLTSYLLTFLWNDFAVFHWL